MNDRSALELAESKLWGLLYQMISADPARAEECDDFGMMPLHWACTVRDVEPRVVRKLADAYPTAVMLKNKGGLIPLHIAIKAKVPLEVLQVLVAKNDDAMCEETPDGETPAELAELYGLAPNALAYLSRLEEELQRAGRMAPRPTRIRPLATSASLRGLVVDADDQRASDVDLRRREIGELRARKLLRGSSSAAAHALPPRWKMDKQCNVCHLKFTYFRSRHHCRNCGLSVCSTHSSKRLPLQHIGLNMPQRVCIMCYDEVRENGKPPSAVANLYGAKRQDVRKPLGDISNEYNHHRSSLTSQARTVVDSSVASQQDDFDASDDDDLAEFHDSDHEGAPPPRSRPRAQTDMEGIDRIAAMKSQVKELETHMRELLEQKERMQSAIEQSHRKVEHAIQEKHAHESAIADTRGESIIDVTRVTDDDELARQVQKISLSVEDAVANPDDMEMPDDAVLNVAATCHYLGLALFEKGDYADAVEELRKSVSLNRRDPDAWYTLARALQAENESFEAEIAVKRALDLDPKNYAAMSLLGKILHARGDHDKSIDIFQRALGLMTTASDSDDEEDVGSMTVGW